MEHQVVDVQNIINMKSQFVTASWQLLYKKSAVDDRRIVSVV